MPYPRSDGVPFNPNLEKDITKIEGLAKTSGRIRDAELIPSVPIIANLSLLWGNSYVDHSDQNLLQVAAFHSLDTGEAADLSRLHQSDLGKMLIRSFPSKQPTMRWPKFDAKPLRIVAEAVHEAVQPD